MSQAAVFTNVAIGKDKKTVAVPTHQAVSNAEFPPKYIYVIRDTSLPTAFNGSETWCEFSLPREMGVLDSMRLAVDVAVDGDNRLMPTPFWIARTEVYWGSDLVETIYDDDLYHESVGMISKQYFDEIKTLLNVGKQYDINGRTITDGNHRFFIPLKSHLDSMRPFVRGVDATIKIRVYFASNVMVGASENDSNPTNKVTLQEAQLFVGEAQLSRAETEKVEKQHRGGVVQYAGVFRERQSDSLSFNSSSSTPQYLRSFKHDSAGLLVYLRAQGNSNVSKLLLRSIKDLTLQDAVGNKLTETQRSDFLKVFVWTDQMDSPFTTHKRFTQPEGANLFLIPFSSSFQDTLRTGNNYGKRSLTSQERLIYSPAASGGGLHSDDEEDGGDFVITPDLSTPASANVNVTSYSYGYVVVKGGKHYVQMVSTADDKCGKNMW